MSFKPIILWKPQATLASDDACTTILQYKLPPAPSTILPPYQSPHGPEVRLRYVPPLSYFCVKAIAEYPDELHALGAARLRYQAPWSRDQFDILSALIPTYRPFSGNEGSFDLRLVDPRLWAVLVQIYEDLPDVFRQYTLPLSDAHLPLLQTIPSTKHFSLITILSLRECRMLTDDNVVELRHLPTLAAFDASVTALGTWGVQRLAKSLAWSEADEMHPVERRGPWGLRIMYLRDCINIDDKVLYWLTRFPLLSVVDLRGTVCKPWRHCNLPFKPCSDTRLYHPTELKKALDHLASRAEARKTLLFSHPSPYILNVDSLHHKPSSDSDCGYGPVLNHLYDETNSDDEPPKRGRQISHGRMDVFLPYKPPRDTTPSDHWPDDTFPYSPYGSNPAEWEESEHKESDYDSGNTSESERSKEYLEPQPPGPWDMSDSGWGEGLAARTPPFEPDPYKAERSWMDDAADEERRSYLKQRDAVMFYANSVQQQTQRRLDRGARRTCSASNFPTLIGGGNPYAVSTAVQRTADQLMLFRSPPPWSALPISPPAKPAPVSPCKQSPAEASMTYHPSQAPNASSFTVTRPGPKAATSSARHSMPDSVFHPAQASPTIVIEAQSAGKRKRSAINETAPADQVRRRMHTLSSIQSMVNMVQKRSEDMSRRESVPTIIADTRGAATGRLNPFARTAQAGKPATAAAVLTSLKRKASETPAGPLSSTGPRREEQLVLTPTIGKTTSNAHDTVSISRDPSSLKPMRRQSASTSKGAATATAVDSYTEDFHRQPSDTGQSALASSLPSKKLKPITTLTVPDWPTAHDKPLSHHKPKRAPTLANAPVQTTLPLSRPPEKPAKPRDEAKDKRRASAPVAKTPRLQLTRAEKAGKPERTQGQSDGKGSKKGTAFDWQGWSAR
ncbi:hypothetical protein BD414DRAFT_533505 [Trametes punicea]|nr:hypothetical protein BD414DRAFT_533505 [Trametes punicea]